jgi:DNA-binding transcriptional regulator YdaS (Cro superfamily)
MDLKTYLKSLPDEAAREAFAESCETSIGHLRNCIYTAKQLAPASCVLAERHSGGLVMRWDLRPDDWWKIWPELADFDGAPDVPAVAAQA